MDSVTETFEALSAFPDQDALIRLRPQIERFVILLYDRSSECFEVDKARKDLFTRKGRAIENIPPSSAALIQHTKRAAYQAGCVWGQCLLSEPQLENPSDWGWCKNKTGEWEPFWTSLPQASDCCSELIKCSCKSEKGCRGRCHCVKAEMLCTALCKCGGDCDRNIGD